MGNNLVAVMFLYFKGQGHCSRNVVILCMQKLIENE
jgi:hypothetical protein